MLKVLVANTNIEQNSSICNFLTNDKDISLISTHDARFYYT